MGRWRTATVTEDSGGAYEKLWSWDGLVELFWIVASRQTPESPTGQPFGVGYLCWVGIALGKTVPSSGELNPERMFVLCYLGPPQIREKSRGAPFRGSWKGMLAILHKEGAGGGGEERRGNGKGRRVEGSCPFSLCFGCAGCSLRCTGFSCWSTRTQQFQLVGWVIPWHMGS